jgi:hypothetical protein
VIDGGAVITGLGGFSLYSPHQGVYIRALRHLLDFLLLLLGLGLFIPSQHLFLPPSRTRRWCNSRRLPVRRLSVQARITAWKLLLRLLVLLLVMLDIPPLLLLRRRSRHLIRLLSSGEVIRLALLLLGEGEIINPLLLLVLLLVVVRERGVDIEIGS